MHLRHWWHLRAAEKFLKKMTWEQRELADRAICDFGYVGSVIPWAMDAYPAACHKMMKRILTTPADEIIAELHDAEVEFAIPQVEDSGDGSVFSVDTAVMRRHYSPEKRAMLAGATLRSYIEVDPYAEDDVRGGYIAGIIRDDEGVPACFKVARTPDLDGPFSYIAATEVEFYEPWDSPLQPWWMYEEDEEYDETADKDEDDELGETD